MAPMTQFISTERWQAPHSRRGLVAGRIVIWLAVALGTIATAQTYLIDAQLEYQRSRITAYHQHRIQLGLAGGALPPGEYVWTMEFRCVTHEACIETFGFALMAPWQESYTFIGHVTSDGVTMSYRGASVFRGRAGAGDDATCQDPNNVPFAGTCVFGESAEVFVKSADPEAVGTSVAVPLLWVRNATLVSPQLDGDNRSLACTCEIEGVPTPTPAIIGTLHAADFAGDREVPAGVELTVQLVKVS